MYSDIAKSSTAWGSTNFQSIVDEIVRIRKTRPYISLSDYPTTILVVSDMQFNPATSWNDRHSTEMTNYEAMKEKLSRVFPKEFVDSMKFVWWQVNGKNVKDMPATLDDGGCYFFSGFDGSLITMLLGGENQVVDKTTGEKRTPTMEELMEMAMNQDVLNLVQF
jgi:hypothetical protein